MEDSIHHRSLGLDHVTTVNNRREKRRLYNTMIVNQQRMQWNLSIVDTIGTAYSS